MKSVWRKTVSVVLLVLALAVMAAPVLVAAEEAPAPAAAPAAAAPAPPKIDTGDTAWMIVATALVMLMSIPGLALFYGGLAKTKDALNTMAMTFVTFCIASLLWVLYGYSFSFAGSGSILGDASKVFLKGIGPNSISDLAKTIPALLFGMLAGVLVEVAATYRLTRFRPRFTLSETKEVLGFSGWWLASEVTTMIGRRGQDLLVGQQVGAAALGK